MQSVCIKRLSAENLARLLKLVVPEQLYLSVIEHHIQRHMSHMTEARLHGTDHPPQLWSPLILGDPHPHARKGFVRYQGVHPRIHRSARGLRFSPGPKAELPQVRVKHADRQK